jgi:hypothetical protein
MDEMDDMNDIADITDNIDAKMSKSVAASESEVNCEEEEEKKTASSVTCSSRIETESDASNSACPLFMDGLPTDFKSNPALAALASLLEDSDSDEVKDKTKVEEDKTTTMSGGGKVVRKKKTSNRSKPYNNNHKKKPQASVGEAQLFLKMWKM